MTGPREPRQPPLPDDRARGRRRRVCSARCSPGSGTSRCCDVQPVPGRRPAERHPPRLHAGSARPDPRPQRPGHRRQPRDQRRHRRPDGRQEAPDRGRRGWRRCSASTPSRSSWRSPTRASPTWRRCRSGRPTATPSPTSRSTPTDFPGVDVAAAGDPHLPVRQPRRPPARLRRRDQRHRARRPQERRLPARRPDREVGRRAGLRERAARSARGRPSSRSTRTARSSARLEQPDPRCRATTCGSPSTSTSRTWPRTPWPRAWPPARGPVRPPDRATSTPPRPAPSSSRIPATARSSRSASQPTYDPSQFVNGIPTSLFQQLNDPAPNAAPHRPGDVGPVRPRLDVQAGHRDRRAQHGPDHPGHALLRQGLHQGRAAEVQERRGQRLRHHQPAHGRSPSAPTPTSTHSAPTSGRTAGRSRSRTPPRSTGSARGPASPSAASRPGRVPDPTTRRKEFEQNPEACTRPASGSPATTSTSPSARASWSSPRCSCPTPTPPSPTAAPCTSPGWPSTSRTRTAPRSADVPPKPAAPGAARPPATGRRCWPASPGVVQNGDGTAHGAFAGFPFGQLPVAGKTGTAQVARQGADLGVRRLGVRRTTRSTWSTVFEEQAGYGASASAPVARRILDGAARPADPAPRSTSPTRR